MKHAFNTLAHAFICSRLDDEYVQQMHFFGNNRFVSASGVFSNVTCSRIISASCGCDNFASTTSRRMQTKPAYSRS